MNILLFKSRIRCELLRLLYENLGSEFYLREMARRVGASAGTVHRELLKLEQDGLIVSKKMANLKIFKANKKSPTFFELQSIIRKTIGIEHELKISLERIRGLEFAFIFGSYVKGDFRSDSDIDLFLIGSQNSDKVHKIISKIEKAVSREINYHEYDIKDFKNKFQKRDSFLEDITKHYILVKGDPEKFAKLIGKT